jgi:membrane protein DedA with SNARE-associated domain
MSLDFSAMTHQVVDVVRNNQDWAPVIVFGLAFGKSLAIISLMLPFMTMLVGVSVLTGGGHGPQFWAMLACATFGAACGSWASYALGYYQQRRILSVWPLRKYPETVPKVQALFEAWGAWAVLIGRFSGPLRATVPLVAGIVRMPVWQFQAANWVSAVLWSVILLGFGQSLSASTPWLSRLLGLGM